MPARRAAVHVPGLGEVANRLTILNLLDRVNLIRPAEAIGIFQPAYGPRLTALNTLTIPFWINWKRTFPASSGADLPNCLPGCDSTDDYFLCRLKSPAHHEALRPTRESGLPKTSRTSDALSPRHDSRCASIRITSAVTLGSRARQGNIVLISRRCQATGMRAILIRSKGPAGTAIAHAYYRNLTDGCWDMCTTN